MTMIRALRRHQPMTYAEAKAGRWQTVRSKGGHIQIVRGDHLVTTSSSPSDPRTDMNTRAQLRRCQRGQCSCRTAMKERAS